MEKMIGYCGYNCHLCAARSGDPEERARLVAAWRKFYGHERYTVENVACDGCKGGGRLADKSCQAKPCAEERGVETCADCGEFPCPKVRNLLGETSTMLLQCLPGTSGLTAEEYNAGMRQFDGIPNLLTALIASGRLPAWCGKCARTEAGIEAKEE
jgi:hypothetical protein